MERTDASSKMIDDDLIVDFTGFDGANENQGSISSTTYDIMIPYSDLMSLLLVFFVFFFIISDFKKGQMIAEKNQLLMEKTRLDSLLKLNEEVITIPSEILFESGKAELDLNAKLGLEKVALKIRNRIQGEDSWDIRIEGHTDNVPIVGGKYASNWDLSTARAISIVKFFLENNFFPPDQMQAMGYGEFKPIAPNDSVINRRKNRRVEIKVSKNYSREN